MARRFLFVSLGILALSLAYQIGASRTEAQASGAPFVALAHDASQGQFFYALASDGDVWRFNNSSFTPTFVGNVLSGPVPVEGSTWGEIKSKFGK